jgi:hypothetical protein
MAIVLDAGVVIRGVKGTFDLKGWVKCCCSRTDRDGSSGDYELQRRRVRFTVPDYFYYLNAS